MLDLRINDGTRMAFDAMSVSVDDIVALGGQLRCLEVLPAPFTGLRYSYNPNYYGMRFSVFSGNRQHLTCAIAVDKEEGEKVWARLMETCSGFQHGLSPEELQHKNYEGVDFEDATRQVYALKHGCPDLVKPGVKVTCPPVPFLATLISPPGHRTPESAELKQAFRLRDTVAALILKSNWFQREHATG